MIQKASGLSIGEVAAHTGLRSSALRYYERIGLLSSPARSHGQRRYSPDVVDRLCLIGFAKQAGFRLAEIKRLLGTKRERGSSHGVATQWRQIVPGKMAELTKEIARLEEGRHRLLALLACECRSPEQCGRQIRDREVKRTN